MVYCDDCERDVYLDYYNGLTYIEPWWAANKHHDETGHEVVFQECRTHVIPRSYKETL